MKIAPVIVLFVLIFPTQQFGIIAGLFIGGCQIFINELQRFTASQNSFMTTYGKTYSSVDELTYRTAIFKTNLNGIDNHNNNPNRTYSLGVTQFTDLTAREFELLLLMPKFRFVEATVSTNVSPAVSNTKSNTKTTSFVSPLSLIGSFFMPTPRVVQPLQPVASTINVGASSSNLKSNGFAYMTNSAPSYDIDWRKRNAVGVVKQQGICGACYAFSALGAIESMYRINNMTTMGITGKMLGNTNDATLSEQHIIDCCNVPGRCHMGCNGGYVWDVLNFVKNHGVSIEKSYPYKTEMTESYQRKCQGVNGQFKNILNQNAPYTNVTRRNVTDLKQKLLKGPVSVLIDATNMPFYVSPGESKVIPFKNCSETVNNHAVLLAGIDSNENWIIKNSWGSEWGEKGYITLAPGNTCGIANYAVLPNPYV